MVIQLDIVSDPVCPWCWLGKRRLDAAMRLRPDLAVEVSWRPFQLDASVPAAGVDYKTYWRQRLEGAGEDGAARFSAMRAHLEEAGAAIGISYRFDAITHRPNTLNAHRLIRWAGGQGRADVVVEALFHAYFDAGRDIGDLNVLLELGEATGLDRGIVADLLAGDADRDAVEAEEAHFRKLGVTSVPTFVAQGALALPGAHEPEQLASFLDEAAQMQPSVSDA